MSDYNNKILRIKEICADNIKEDTDLEKKENEEKENEN